MSPQPWDKSGALAPRIKKKNHSSDTTKLQSSYLAGILREPCTVPDRDYRRLRQRAEDAEAKAERERERGTTTELQIARKGDVAAEILFFFSFFLFTKGSCNPSAENTLVN